MEDWVCYLLLTTPGVSNVAIGLLGPDVNVVHEDAHFDATSLVFVEVKVAAVAVRHQRVEVPCRRHTLQTLVLHRYHSLTSNKSIVSEICFFPLLTHFLLFSDLKRKMPRPLKSDL